MKIEALLILLAVVLVLSSLPVKAAIVYCPNGDCAPEDPAGSKCNSLDVKNCVGSLYYGSKTGCSIGTSECSLPYFLGVWQDCSGWKNSYYQATESKCDFIDNDCDGYVDEGGVCDVSEMCTNAADDNSNAQIDCQDDKCLYSFESKSQACVTLEDVDVDDSLRIDGYDLALVANHLGTSQGDTGWNASADINKDLVISDKDVAWVDSSFGWSVPTDERNSGRCAQTPQNTYVGWIAPGNTSGRGSVNARIGSSLGYKIDFFPQAGHNYTTKAFAVNGSCCVRDMSPGFKCTEYAEDEQYILYDVVNNVYNPIAYQQKLGICGVNLVDKKQLQSAWGWQITSYGQPDCSQLNCISNGYRWQDVNAQCSYLAEDFNKEGQPGGSFALIPANESSTWSVGNQLYIRNETFAISCISLDGGLNCGGGFPGLDKVILNRYPYRNQLQGNILGISPSCTLGNQANCDETTISTTSTTIVGTTTSTTTTISDFNGSSTIPTTTIGGAGGGFGVCGDGVVNTGEQCEQPGDCIPLGMNDCDMTGLITGFECRCYSNIESGGTETILFTTSCQDVGNGQQGLRTETTKVIDSATGNVISETSEQVTCGLPPINVPGFSLVNILLVSSILLIYYAYKKK